MKTRLLNLLLIFFLSLTIFSSCSNEDFLDERANSNAIILPSNYATDGSWYSIYLIEVGLDKMRVIKVVRETLLCDLRLAKILVDSAPCELAIIRDQDVAEKFKTDLEEAGARVKMELCDPPF